VRLLRMDYASNPDDPSTLLHLGQAYLQLGKGEEARSYFRRLLNLENRPVDYLRRVYASLASLSLTEGKFGEAVEITKGALQLFRQDAHLSYLQAEALYELDDYQAAAATLMQIIAEPERTTYHAGAPEGIRTLLAPRSLGEVLRIQRKFEEAEAVLKAVLEAYPEDVTTWHALGRVYIDEREAENVYAVCERLRECRDGESCALLLMAAWHLCRGDVRRAEEILEQLIKQEPQMAIARLMRAECLTRREAPKKDRLHAYRNVVRAEPGNMMAVEMIEKLEAELREPQVTGRELWSTTVVCGGGI
jgi:tetratricopeptide (TPR) repeat protein